jgi:Na+-driven multidrug efflux pump
MAAPLVVSFWMRAAVTFVDTIYAALVGDAAVAAIGLTVPFEFTMIAVWVGLSTGLTSGLSRAMGTGAGAKIQQYLRSGWRLVAIVSPLFTVLGAGIWLAAPRIGLGESVGRAFQIYGAVLIGGSAFTTFWSVIPDSLVKAHQDTRSTMWAGIWTNVINVGLNTLFIFVFHWGVFGIALSTVLGRIGGLAYALVQAGRHERRRRASGESDRPGVDRAPYRTILGLAVPSSMTFMLMALESGLVNGLLATLKHATEAIAAYAIFYRVVLFGLQPVIALAVATLPFAARRVGLGDMAGVRRGFRQANVAASLYCVALLGPLMWLLAPWLAERLTESPLTREYTAWTLLMVPWACLAGTLFLICRPAFEAMNRGRPGLLMAMLRYLVLTGPLAWLGMETAERYGQPALYGLVFGLLVAATVSSAVFWLWLRATLAESEPRAPG